MLLTAASVLSLLSSFSVVTACSDGHAHTHQRSRRSNSAAVPPLPKAPLEWGDINIIHTTDTHGWLLGHQHSSWPEPNYNGTLGDFASFVEGMRKLAKKKGKDLLLVDSGDIHDGTGLTDADPNSVDGHHVLNFFQDLQYNVMTVGNHEMYKRDIAIDMNVHFAKPLAPNRHFVTSNAYINGTGSNNASMPVGELYAKFTTDNGRKVTALGILFTKFQTDSGLYHQDISTMISEKWFQDAIADKPDLFLLAGHMPLANYPGGQEEDEWDKVVAAIHRVHDSTPIAILGGHSHIRDCRRPNEYSMALQSGRYMETVGWMSIKLGSVEGKYRPGFTRRYLDPNRVTYEYHTSTNPDTFVTAQGKKFDQDLNALATQFDLGQKYGRAPKNYTLTQANATSEGSVYHLYVNEAMPAVLKTNRSNPTINFINGGSLRYDVYSGDFTKNDQIVAMNYADPFQAVYDVPFRYATKVVPYLNEHPKPTSTLSKRDTERVDEVFGRWLEAQSESSVADEDDAEDHVLGYVTEDKCGPKGSGDDVVHTPVKYFATPPFVGSTPSITDDDTKVDIVFLNVSRPHVIRALNAIQTSKKYSDGDVHDHTQTLSNEVLGLYATKKWN